jgi:hypothetical protein
MQGCQNSGMMCIVSANKSMNNMQVTISLTLLVERLLRLLREVQIIDFSHLWYFDALFAIPGSNDNPESNLVTWSARNSR